VLAELLPTLLLPTLLPTLLMPLAPPPPLPLLLLLVLTSAFDRSESTFNADTCVFRCSFFLSAAAKSLSVDEGDCNINREGDDFMPPASGLRGMGVGLIDIGASCGTIVPIGKAVPVNTDES
jgi:hypothetical protein